MALGTLLPVLPQGATSVGVCVLFLGTLGDSKDGLPHPQGNHGDTVLALGSWGSSLSEQLPCPGPCLNALKWSSLRGGEHHGSGTQSWLALQGTLLPSWGTDPRTAI